MINLLNTLHNKKVSFKVDKICSKVGKGDCLSVREAYRVFQPSVDIVFLVKGIWVCCALKDNLFCLGSNLGQGPHSRPITNKGELASK